ncbi:MAG: 2-C-methyl-D-erythritol 2,4-cyclodiphosphate synthase [Gammaproteobacteria bacterium]
MNIRIGQGFDAHRFKEGDKLIIGGVEIPHSHGMEAHSDGDVLIHALCDAILGALGEGDIGKHFPDTDQQFKGIDSRVLLRHVVKLMQQKAYQLGNADMTIIAQAPKMAPHLTAMQARLAADLHTDPANINIKATTTEHMGFTGRGEGIAALAMVLLQRSTTSD